MRGITINILLGVLSLLGIATGLILIVVIYATIKAAAETGLLKPKTQQTTIYKGRREQ